VKIYKAYDANFKALGDAPGSFEAIVSVFGNVDLQGDRVMPGAFTKTIADWRVKNAPLPIVWSHEWLNPDAHIGYAMPEDIMELSLDVGPNGENGGLYVKGRMDVNKPFAGQVFDLLKEGRIREWSFAYDTIDERPAEDGANELHEVAIIEAGPTLKGANSSTFTVSAKAKAIAEAELKEAYDTQRSLTKFLDILRHVDDPELSRSLSKTYAINNDAPVQTSRFHVEVVDGTFACVSNKTGKVVDTHEGSDEADTHVAKLRNMSVTKLPNEARAALDLEAVAELSDPVTVLAEVAGQEFKVSPAALEPVSQDQPEVSGDKAAGKPWHIEEQDGQYCCIVDSSGETLDCHDTEEGAAEHIVALYAEESSEDPDGAKLEDVTGIREHLISEHSVQPAELEGTEDAPMQAQHREAHGRSSATGHEHDTQADEGKSVGSVTVDVTPVIQPIKYTTSNTGITYNVTSDLTLVEAIDMELKSALADGEKIGRTIGRNSATALKEALIAAVDNFVTNVNAGAAAGEADDDGEPKNEELDGYNAKFAELLGED